jgi:ribulose-phosphate 3-epimerase
LTICPPVVASLGRASSAFLDVHPMVGHPETYVQPMGFAGAGSLAFHFEAARDIPALTDAIHDGGMRACIAIKPATPVDCVLPSLDMFDMVLVMTVEPGFGGQPFMADMMCKVRRIREMRPGLDIQVDGGINLQTIDIAAEAGANCIVTGAVFRTADPAGVMRKLRKSVDESIARKWENLQ